MEKITKMLFAIVVIVSFTNCTKSDAPTPIVSNHSNQSIQKFNNTASSYTASFIWSNPTGASYMINGITTNYSNINDSINVSVNVGDVIQMSDENPTNSSFIKLKINFNFIPVDSIGGHQGVLENRFQYIVQ